MLLGGYGTGRNAVSLVAETRGTVVAALSYPYRGEAPREGSRIALAMPAIRAAILDTPPAILLALEHLLGATYVDAERVELIGVSLGAPFVIVAGALDRRPRRVWSIHGAGDLRLLIASDLRRRLAFPTLCRVLAGLAYLCAAGGAIQPERWVGLIAPRPFVMLNSLGDERMPRRATLRLYERARQPKELIWLPGPHVTPERREVVQQLVDHVLGAVVPDPGRPSSS